MSLSWGRGIVYRRTSLLHESINPNPIETERTLNYHEAVFEEGVTYKCKSDQSLFVNQKVLFYDFSGF